MPKTKRSKKLTVEDRLEAIEERLDTLEARVDKIKKKPAATSALKPLGDKIEKETTYRRHPIAELLQACEEWGVTPKSTGYRGPTKTDCINALHTLIPKGKEAPCKPKSRTRKVSKASKKKSKKAAAKSSKKTASKSKKTAPKSSKKSKDVPEWDDAVEAYTDKKGYMYQSPDGVPIGHVDTESLEWRPLTKAEVAKFKKQGVTAKVLTEKAITKLLKAIEGPEKDSEPDESDSDSESEVEPKTDSESEVDDSDSDSESDDE